MDRKPLSLRCNPEQYSTLLWPPAMCNHSCIRQDLARYAGGLAALSRLARKVSHCNITALHIVYQDRGSFSAPNMHMPSCTEIGASSLEDQYNLVSLPQRCMCCDRQSIQDP